MRPKRILNQLKTALILMIFGFFWLNFSSYLIVFYSPSLVYRTDTASLRSWRDALFRDPEFTEALGDIPERLEYGDFHIAEYSFTVKNISPFPVTLDFSFEQPSALAQTRPGVLALAAGESRSVSKVFLVSGRAAYGEYSGINMVLKSRLFDIVEHTQTRRLRVKAIKKKGHGNVVIDSPFSELSIFVSTTASSLTPSSV